MKTIAFSNIATRFSAICALAVAGAVLTGSISPAFAHKGGGGKSGNHGQHQPKPPKNPGPIGPLPKPMPPQGNSQPTPKPVPVVVRDHRTPKVGTTSGGGVKVTSTPIIRDHRATPVVRDHRAQPVVRDQRGGKTTTVKVLGQKVVTVTSKGGKRCAYSVCL